MAIIYKIENKINGKVYIGQSLYSLEQRLYGEPYGHFYMAFGEHRLHKRINMYLHKALRKYGKDNFDCSVIEQIPDELARTTTSTGQDYLSAREIYWIAHYKSNNSKYGYNQTSGGHKHYTRTDENKAKISEATKRAMNCESVRLKISEGVKRAYKDPLIVEKHRNRTIEGMHKYDTKVLCNPKKYMTEEQIKEWKSKNAESSRKRALQQWKDPVIREKMLRHRKGSKWMNKDNVVKFVRKDLQEQFLLDGWHYGQKEVAR